MTNAEHTERSMLGLLPETQHKREFTQQLLSELEKDQPDYNVVINTITNLLDFYSLNVRVKPAVRMYGSLPLCPTSREPSTLSDKTFEKIIDIVLMSHPHSPANEQQLYRKAITCWQQYAEALAATAVAEQPENTDKI